MFIKTTAIPFLLFIFFIATPVFAADIFLEPDTRFGRNDQFKMDVFLNAEEPLNAVEGTLHFPSDLLALKRVDDGNSIVNFWVEYPYALGGGDIRFSGITPGGYAGSRGLIFSVIFQVLQKGEGMVDIRGARALSNDGKGTEVTIKTVYSRFAIPQTMVFQTPVSETKDENPPESFVPEIARDAGVFDGKWFLVFSAQDKTAGIDRYEVKETRRGIFKIFTPWIRAESPYVLRDQELRSRVFVKAVDKAGNARIEGMRAKNAIRWYENYENMIIMLLGVLIALFIIKKPWKRKRT